MHHKNYFSSEKNSKFKFELSTISGSGPNGAIIHYKATKKLTENEIGEVYSGLRRTI